MAMNVTQKLVSAALVEGEMIPGAEIALRVDQVLLQDVLGTLAMLEFAWIFPIAAGTMIQSLGGIQNTALILGSVYVVGLVVPWFLPETNGRPLPE